jgi:hypothetical protein
MKDGASNVPFFSDYLTLSSSILSLYLFKELALSLVETSSVELASTKKPVSSNFSLNFLNLN